MTRIDRWEFKFVLRSGVPIAFTLFPLPLPPLKHEITLAFCQFVSWYAGPSGILLYPDGRRMEFDVDELNQYWQRSNAEPGDRLVPAPGLPYGHYDLLLADGGRVEFRFDTPPPPRPLITLKPRGSSILTG